MDPRRFLTIGLTFAAIVELHNCKDGIVIKNSFPFPWAGNEFVPFMGIILAVAFPLHLHNYNVFVSFNLEANYNLPINQTEFLYPPIISKRDLDRKDFYKMLEKKFVSHGFKGRLCLLRTICEAAEYNLLNNGVLGDILHILFTPSTSNNTKLASDYGSAEEYGKINGHCKKYKKRCTISLLNLISAVEYI